MKRFKGCKKKGFLGISVLVLALLFYFGMNQKGEVRAAGSYLIKFSSEEKASADIYRLRRKKIDVQCMNGDEPMTSGETVTWQSSDTDILEVVSMTSQSATLIAKGAGQVTLTALIKTNSNPEGIPILREVLVGYAISQDDENGFTLESKLSNEAIMILSVGKTGTLDFMFPLTEGVTWSAKDSTVVKMVGTVDGENKNNTGQFKAVGTGRTTITAEFKNAEGKLDTDTVEVYVGPNPMQGGTVIDKTVFVKNGDPIYTGVVLDDTNKQIWDCIEWIVWDSNGVEVDNSVTGKEGVIISSTYSPNLIIDAKAGIYVVTIYTVGVYSAGIKELNPLSKTFTINVVAECSAELEKSLQINDTFDIAEAYNMRNEDFKECFNVTVVSGSGIVIEENGIITTIGEGIAGLKLTVKNNKKLRELLEPNTVILPAYMIEINAYRGFLLNYSSVTIAEGATLKLRTDYSDGTVEGITWISKDKNFVTVDEEGIITGEKDSAGKEILVIATMTLSDGRKLNATCKVTVKKTAKEIFLDKKVLRLQVGHTGQVTASYDSGITSIPGLKWIIENPKVASVAGTSSNTVEVIANGSGTTILTAVNSDNFVAAYCEIIVMAPITEISIVEKSPVKVFLSQENIKLHYRINGDATDTAVKWGISDIEGTGVADIDDTGFLTLNKAGTVLVTIEPVWNPNGVMASCQVMISQSATSITLDGTSYELEVGETKQLVATPTPNNATTEIIWDTVDSSIATVSSTGLVTAKSVGKTYIMAYTKNGLLQKCQIIVKQKATGVTIDKSSLNLAVGESYTVVAKPNPPTSTETKFEWSSNKPNIAKVQDGKITGVAPGDAIIRVKPTVGDSELIYVTVYSKATGMSFSEKSVEMVKGEKYTLKPVFTPADVTDKGVKYTSLDAAVATIDENGVIKALKGGTTVITGISDDGGHIATCVVTVKERITTLKLDKYNVTLATGKSYKLKASVTSNSASNPKLKWTTSNKDIVTVNQKGKIKAKKVGVATITVKVTDGSNKKATCKVMVTKAVTSVTLDKRVVNILLGNTYKLKATVKPTDATNKGITWKSENPEIAVVEGGEIITFAPGTTKITVTAKDGSGKSATCYVNVTEEVPATSIMLSVKNLTLIKGQSQKIGYSILPYNHTDKIFFDSDNRAVATVNSNGTVFARRAGAANITLVTTSGKQSTVAVTVIGLNKTKVTMEQYDTETLSVDGATSGITWFTSNPSVATVDRTGKIVARKSGTCTVYAKVSGINLGCTVVVTNMRR